MISLGLWGFGKKTVEVKFPCHCIISGGKWFQYDLSMVILTLITWLRWCLLCFSTIKLLFCIFHVLFFWNWASKSSPYSRSGELYSPSFRMESLHNLFQILFCWGDFSLLPIHIFIQLFISVWTNGYLSHSLSYKPILLCYFVIQIYSEQISVNEKI